MRNITTILFAVISLFLVTEANAQEQKTKKKKRNKKEKVVQIPEIIFESKVYNYGQILVNSDGIATFVLKNTGNGDLIITNCSASCGCTVPEWPKEPIAPGATATISVKYDTRRKGIINKNIYVMSNAPEERIMLNIRGEVVEMPPQVVPEDNSSPFFTPTE